MHSDLLEIDRMRVLLAIALLGFGIAGVGAARAADLPAGYSAPYSGRYFEHAQHSEMLWLYDDQPGVVVRGLLGSAVALSPLFSGHRHFATDRPSRKSVGYQPPAETGEDVPPFLVERLGGRAPLCRQRAVARAAGR
jgi:hypothetical protein